MNDHGHAAAPQAQSLRDARLLGERRRRAGLTGESLEHVVEEVSGIDGSDDERSSVAGDEQSVLRNFGDGQPRPRC